MVQRLTGDAATVGPNRRIQSAEESHKPAVVYNPDRNEYMVAWPSVRTGETEIRVQRVLASGDETGRDDVQVSSMGPDGAPAYLAGVDVGVGYSPTSRQYVVTWPGDDTENGLVDDEWEVFGQSLDEELDEVGPDDAPISSMGPDGSTLFGVGGRELLTGPVAWDAREDRFLVVYDGDDDASPMVDNELEIFSRQFEPFRAPVEPPPPEPPSALPPPPPPVCPPVIVPAPDRDRNGCPDATAITKRFQVEFHFKRNRIAYMTVRGVPSGGRAAVVCKGGCAGPRGRTVARGRKARRKRAVRLSMKRVRLGRTVKLEVRVAQGRRARRYIEFRVRPRVPSVKRVSQGCMWPTIAKRVTC
jgi:hypothetical protein